MTVRIRGDVGLLFGGQNVTVPAQRPPLDVERPPGGYAAILADPWLELFSRSERPGWLHWGKETSRWRASESGA